MAIPGFYNQGDQEIYEEGEHFIPQERYRLGYTAPPSIANAPTTTGITNTQAASPYIWPPQVGGNGGGGGSGNKFGLNMDTVKTVIGGQWSTDNNPFGYGSYKATPRQIAQTEGGIWKDINTNQNVYHANIPYKGVLGTIADKVLGRKSRPGFPDEGSWTGADWDEDFDPRFAGTRLNTYQRWKEKRNIAKAEEKAAADKVAEAEKTRQEALRDAGAYSSQVQMDPGGGGSWHQQTAAKEAAGQQVAGPGFGKGAYFYQGGRVGYRWGESVDPEEPAENIFEIMQDQNIPFGEMVEAGPTEEQVAMVIDMDGRGMGIDEIMSFTQLGKETIMNILGVEMAQGGIARLL